MKSTKFFIVHLIFLAVALGLTVNANAETIYATGEDGTELVTIDTVSGVGTVIGSTGTAGTFATAFDPYGTLYTATNVRSDGSNSYLGTFDLSTGAVTTIGDPLGIGYMTSLEFDLNGTLYGGSFGSSGNDVLYTIDTATGSTTSVGNMGFTAVMDFAFDSSGTLWAVGMQNDLYTIDTGTGQGTFVTKMTVAGDDNEDIMGISFDSNDTLYAIDFDWNIPPGVSVSPIYTIDTSTGVATHVADSGLSMAHGGDIYLVPEPISSTLFIVGGATLGFRRFRKKFKK